jgi:hypothetical protein
MTSEIVQRFTAETVNYFAGTSALQFLYISEKLGSRLNRCTHLRQNNEYLSYVLTHPSTRFLPLKDLSCLCDAVYSLINYIDLKKTCSLAYLDYEEVKDYIGNPFDTPEDERLKNYHSREHQPEPTLVFLGIDESQAPPILDLPGHKIAEKYPGQAYFAIDITSENQSEKYKKGADDIVEKAIAKGLGFLTLRIGSSLSDTESPIVAMARSFVDWNLRNVVRSFI